MAFSRHRAIRRVAYDRRRVLSSAADDLVPQPKGAACDRRHPLCVLTGSGGAPLTTAGADGEFRGAVSPTPPSRTPRRWCWKQRCCCSARVAQRSELHEFVNYCHSTAILLCYVGLQNALVMKTSARFAPHTLQGLVTDFGLEAWSFDLLEPHRAGIRPAVARQPHPHARVRIAALILAFALGALIGALGFKYGATSPPRRWRSCWWWCRWRRSSAKVPSPR